MIPILRSELLKLRTTRTTAAIAIAVFALIVLITLVNGLVPDVQTLVERKHQFGLLANGSLAAAFSAIVGVLATTSEFRHGTIRPTLLASPRRSQVIAAKIAASSLFGLAFGACGIALSFGLGRLVMSTRDIPSTLSGRDIALAIGGTIASAALWGALGAGLGAAVRNQVGAIVGMLVWALFVESILFALVPSVGRYLPGNASNVLTQIDTPHQLAVLPGTVLFAAYVVAFSLLGAFVTERRDVS